MRFLLDGIIRSWFVCSNSHQVSKWLLWDKSFFLLKHYWNKLLQRPYDVLFLFYWNIISWYRSTFGGERSMIMQWNKKYLTRLRGIERDVAVCATISIPSQTSKGWQQGSWGGDGGDLEVAMVVPVWLLVVTWEARSTKWYHFSPWRSLLQVVDPQSTFFIEANEHCLQ